MVHSDAIWNDISELKRENSFRFYPVKPDNFETKTLEGAFDTI